jgi:Flp pilus assembly protein TadG
MLAKVFTSFRTARHSLGKSEAGNVLMIVALALPVLLGIAGLGIEGSNWFTTRHDMQNAADAAVLAAATNNSDNYLNEARAMGKQYGFTNGSDDATVTASNAATCPAGGTDCYSVTITKKLALVFAQVLNFTGNTTVGTSNGIQLSVTAIAKKTTIPREYCILTLGNGTTTSQDFRANGASSANLSGCNIASNTSMNCNGHDTGADHADAVGVANDCGADRTSGISPVTDNWSAKNSNIPTNPCSSYSGVNWSSNQTLSGARNICGTLTLTADLTVSGSGQIIIWNGDLDLNGKNLVGASGAEITIIFAGTNASNISHTIKDSGGGQSHATLDIAAPASTSTSVWKGIAIYQATNLTQNVSFTFSGNKPTFNLTGMVYMPHADVTISGVVNKSTNGYSCFTMVSQSLLVNGTAQILSRGECAQAGVTTPTANITGRTYLVD